MKVLVDAQALREALKFSTCGRSTMEFTEIVRLGAGDHGLELTTTDSVTAAWITVPGAVVHEPGMTGWPDKLLKSLLQGLDGEITLDAEGFRCGDGLRYRLPRCSERETANLPLPDEVLASSASERNQDLGIEPEALASAIRTVRYAATKDDPMNRYYLEGMHVGQGHVAGSDGYHLAVVSGFDTEREAIIPHAALDHVLAALDAGCIATIEQEHLVLRGEGLVMASILVAGQYPDVRQIVGTEDERPNYVRLEAAPLLAALRRVRAVSEWAIGPGSKIDPVVTLTAEDGVLALRSGDNVERVPVLESGGKIDAGFVPKRLQAALAKCGECLVIRQADPGHLNRAVAFLPDDHAEASHMVAPCEKQAGRKAA